MLIGVVLSMGHRTVQNASALYIKLDVLNYIRQSVVENQLDKTYVFSTSQSASLKPFLEVLHGQLLCVNFE